MSQQLDQSPSTSRPISPSEGWITVLLGVAMMALLGMVIDPDNGVIESRTLSAVTAAGYLVGFLLAKTRVSDLIAHLIALILGFASAIFTAEPRYTVETVSNLRFKDLFDRNWDRFEVLAKSLDSGSRLPDDVAQIAISLTIWLVGYSSAWMLFRRGWLVWSVFLPATIFLTSLALDRDQATWPALAFTGLAIVQAARHTSFSRAGAWQRRGLGSPRRLGWWSGMAGMALSAAVILAGVGAPLTVPDDAQEWVVGHSQDLADSVVEQLDRIPTRDRNSTPTGNYGQFSDEFRIGEGVPAGDTPIALLRAAEPGYLAARRFDSYDGIAWSSGFDSGAQSDFNAESLPPRIAFGAGQPMNLPEQVLSSHTESSGVVTLYQPGSALLLTLGIHESASVPTAVRVGWQSIDQTFVVDDVSIMDVPVDLRSLIGLLTVAQFEPNELNPGNVQATDPALQAAVAAAQESLLNRPLETTITFDESLGVVVSAKGRLPVYEDVEGVFYSGEGELPATYSLVGLVPNVTNADLNQSSTDYSPYIEARYLTLPETVTQRTIDLAAQVVANAGAATPAEMAKAIESHLRTNYQYLLESSLAPDGQDIVDYFLFDRKVGRCDHYASSMVVMLRSLGVPARIVTGLAPTNFDDASGGYLYRAQDAHAWVEVYFPDIGWIPFEPTPSESLIDLTAEALDEQVPEENSGESSPVPEATEPQAEPSPEPSPVSAVPAQNQDGGSGLVERTTTFPGMILVAAAVLSIFAGLMFAAWQLPLRGLRPGASYFLRFQRLARFWGVEQDRTMTPAEYAQVYGSANPRYAGAATLIADAFVGETYGPGDESALAASRGLQGWLELRKSAVTWRPWRRKKRER